MITLLDDYKLRIINAKSELALKQVGSEISLMKMNVDDSDVLRDLYSYKLKKIKQNDSNKTKNSRMV